MSFLRFPTYTLCCLALLGSTGIAFASNNPGGLSSAQSATVQVTPKMPDEAPAPAVEDTESSVVETENTVAPPAEGEKEENAQDTPETNASEAPVTEVEKADTTPEQSEEQDTITAETKKEDIAEPVIKNTAPLPYIGEMKTITTKYEDTLVMVMREYNLGYVEIRSANPGVDVWIPGEGTEVVLPMRHLIPDAPREGIVINLAEMRLYNFGEDPNNPVTHPIGIGREGFSTPTGKTKIIRKKDGPTWRPTPRMREEDPDLPESVPPGDDNPLGTHALYLNWPAYLIHGTHRPWGIGRRVSSGCIRMYPKDIITTFENTPVGTTVNVIRQPIKTAWIDDVLYLEAHADMTLADDVERTGAPEEYNVPDDLFRTLKKQLGAHYKKADWEKIRTVLKERRGYPIAILDLNPAPKEPEIVQESPAKEGGIVEIEVKIKEEKKPARKKRERSPFN